MARVEHPRLFPRHWFARTFTSACVTVSSTRFARVSGLFAFWIHSRMPRFADRGNASKFVRATGVAA